MAEMPNALTPENIAAVAQNGYRQDFFANLNPTAWKPT